MLTVETGPSAEEGFLGIEVVVGGDSILDVGAHRPEPIVDEPVVAPCIGPLGGTEHSSQPGLVGGDGLRRCRRGHHGGPQIGTIGGLGRCACIADRVVHHRPVGGVDVVLDEDGDAVEGAADALGLALGVEGPGDVEGLGVRLDDAAQGRALAVDGLGSHLPEFDEPANAELEEETATDKQPVA